MLFLKKIKIKFVLHPPSSSFVVLHRPSSSFIVLRRPSSYSSFLFHLMWAGVPPIRKCPRLWTYNASGSHQSQGDLIINDLKETRERTATAIEILESSSPHAMTDDGYLNLAYEFYIGRNVQVDKGKALRFAKMAAVLSYRSFAANQSCEVSKAKFLNALQYISACSSPSRSAICTNESASTGRTNEREQS